MSMELEILKQKFHQLIDQINNKKLLEHFYEILSNLQYSKEKQEIFVKEIEQLESTDNNLN